MRPGPRRAAHFQRLILKAMPVLQQVEDMAFQVARLQRGLARQGMPGRHGQVERFGEYGFEAEGRLIAGGLPYLSEVWHGRHWTIYRVRHAEPIASGAATVRAYQPARIVLRADRAGPVLLHARFSASLHLFDAAGLPVPDADFRPVAGGSAFEFAVPAAGTWFIAS